MSDDQKMQKIVEAFKPLTTVYDEMEDRANPADERAEAWEFWHERAHKLEAALHGVRRELWVDYCLRAGRTDVDPAPFNSRPHIRIIDDAIKIGA